MGIQAQANCFLLLVLVAETAVGLDARGGRHGCGSVASNSSRFSTSSFPRLLLNSQQEVVWRQLWPCLDDTRLASCFSFARNPCCNVRRRRWWGRWWLRRPRPTALFSWSCSRRQLVLEAQENYYFFPEVDIHFQKFMSKCMQEAVVGAAVGQEAQANLKDQPMCLPETLIR